jgi:CIC family chloride channel protein
VERYERLPARFVLPAAALTGGLVGLAGWFSPLMLGSGNLLVENVLKADMRFTAVRVFLVIRFLLTLVSYGTGVLGGIFAPLLVLGALAGLGIGQRDRSRPEPELPHRIQACSGAGTSGIDSLRVHAG